MVLVTSNKQQRLLLINYVQRIVPAELASARREIQALMADLPPEFRLIADWSLVESIDPEGAAEIGHTMDLIYQHGVGLIVRVIPDASKDIGLNILAIFHYPRQPRTITSQNLAEALRQLSLWA
jgi:hypothetical protein